MASLRGPGPVAEDETVAEPGEGESAGSAGDSGGGAQAAPASTAVVKAWARENGYEVKDAGPVSKDVQAAYDAAHTD